MKKETKKSILFYAASALLYMASLISFISGNDNSMSRFFKFGKLHVTKGNGDKLLDILLTASKELKRSLAPTGNLYR